MVRKMGQIEKVSPMVLYNSLKTNLLWAKGVPDMAGEHL